MVTPGAASDVITQNIAKDYNNLKYMFHGYSTSTSIADATCDAAKAFWSRICTSRARWS